MILFIVTIFATLISAQGNGPVLKTPLNAGCDPRVISQAESSFRHRKDSLKALEEAERDLNTLLRSCPLTAGNTGVEKRLRLVQEEAAQANVYIALYYLRADGSGLLQGALSRLKRVDERYPRFSKRDYVLYLLADLSEKNGSQDEAVNYCRRLMAEYPRSIYARRARKRLLEFNRRTHA